MKNKWVYRIVGICFLLSLSDLESKAQEDGWKLVWSEEFEQDGRLDTTVWNYEHGFVRNHEDQWYQPENAYQKNGKLIIEARREDAGRVVSISSIRLLRSILPANVSFYTDALRCAPRFRRLEEHGLLSGYWEAECLGPLVAKLT